MTEYCASKFGLFGFAESLRRECLSAGFPITVSCVCPYLINTGMFAGTKPVLFPEMESIKVAEQVIEEALEQQEQLIVIPWAFSLAPVLRVLLPPQWIDSLVTWMGATTALQHFKGRGTQWNMAK